MFEKDTNSTDSYKLNRKTKVTVKNVRQEDDMGTITYKTTITLKHTPATGIKPLSFNDPEEIQDYLMNIDLNDGQLAIPGTNRKDLA